MEGSEKRAVVRVHILTYNSARFLEQCAESVLAQEHFHPGELQVAITDNASADRSAAIAESLGPRLSVRRNASNLGYSGGHNQGVADFLASGATHLLVLNPDLTLEPGALKRAVEELERHPEAGSATFRLLRCDDELRPLEPAVVDSAGIVMTPQIRHLDRASGELAGAETEQPSFVFGGTGACLLMTRAFVLDLLMPRSDYEEVLFTIYPQLREGAAHRPQLFDEAFFAYREDAGLAWRAQRAGWKCRYVPSAVAYHRRLVTPERRSELPPELNMLGVRNRFLLQLNNLTLRDCSVRMVLEGVLLRNLLVIAATVLMERKSLVALFHLRKLLRRSLHNRRWLAAKVRDRNIRRWFRPYPYAEPSRGLSPEALAKGERATSLPDD